MTTISQRQLQQAFDAPAASTRLQAALAAGTSPQPGFAPSLVAQCGREPDFFVRDMLTWALTRHDHTEVVELVLPELRSAEPQARSQALHTLTKIADPTTWRAITLDLLRDSDDEVARTAWRAAAGLYPEEEKPQLAKVLASQFGRGDRDVRLSLSRAFAQLGPAAEGVVARARHHPRESVRAHALATERIMADPEEGFHSAYW
ncbi:hypothetical protein CATRI_10785 [Corynebacterium atrinae]|uniref:HEAT repeat domain-containing protein n=1 Tax=Corynebacterium atrinae TaxID=1336740 RepID=UPI0025B36533|nr:HEAT repeat domain-containing protein [Corynebacterium atrinae]WJY64217.1 hypothetical protein CATRI_10785 [Corynebacterium atrinae]